MIVVKTPWLLKKIYPSSLVWNNNRSEKVIYLTFDDGPIPIVTPFVLETLKKFNAKATFFCIGDNIVKHPDIFDALKQDGHAVGNHTFHHLRGWSTDNAIYLKDIDKCQQLTQSNLFRPPYGRIKRSQIKAVRKHFPQMKIIMWDVLSADYDPEMPLEKCLKNVLNNTENGSIVVFHDSLKAQQRVEYVLPIALEFWSGNGYEFRTL